MLLSSLLDRFNEPETLRMAKLGRELRAKGLDVIDLSLGEPDFDTPDYIKNAAIKAIQENYSHYPPVAGFVELREAICHKFFVENQLEYQTSNIIVSTGAKQSLANAILAIVDEGDEVIIPTPYWVTYSELVKLAKGKVIEIKTNAEEKYKITPVQLENSITEKTKLFIFSSPCNPSGAVYTKQELEALSQIFLKHPQILIISDEIYEHINYIGKPISIASFNEIKNRVIIINGLSKAFAMTGWRLGFMAADESIAKACEKIQGQFTSGANSITQRAAITALTSNKLNTIEMVKEFENRLNKLMKILKDIPEIKCPRPDGAFYIFPDMSYYFGKYFENEIISNSSQLSMYLLNLAHVTSVMGDAFGDSRCIRFSFANNLKNIEEGWSRIKQALSKLK